jgi:hypothetical protein
LRALNLGMQPCEVSRALEQVVQAVVPDMQWRSGGGCALLPADQWKHLPRGTDGVQGIAALVSSTSDQSGLPRLETAVRTGGEIVNLVSWLAVVSVKGQVLFLSPMFGGAVDPKYACEIDKRFTSALKGPDGPVKL